MDDHVVNGNASSETSTEADYEAAARRFARSALNPLGDRASSQELLDSMSRLADVTDPANCGGFKLFSKSHDGSAMMRDAIAAALAARDAADQAEPRRLELPERWRAVSDAGVACIDGMRAVERARTEAEAEAIADGFVINPDGSVSLDEGMIPDDETRVRRARHEHRLMQIHGQETDLQARTVATIRERIGADVPGMPWAILECARGGHDLTETFTSCLALPDSPFTTLMHEIVAYAEEANAAVWPYPGERK
ncbi:hypothetical protein [Mycobacteroides abscessus]|uniref:hypothetical protein n=1 Tax=Mycobacteroides abscessus TaxID=36809 RepID=UPI000C25C635|nr:hypothetical protein [Mycobacteroides abscessus]